MLCVYFNNLCIELISTGQHNWVLDRSVKVIKVCFTNMLFNFHIIQNVFHQLCYICVTNLPVQSKLLKNSYFVKVLHLIIE